MIYKGLFTHPWNVPPEEARDIQKRIAAIAIHEDRLPDPIRFVGSVDAHYNEHTQKQTATIVVMEMSTGTIVDEAAHTTDITFPYISGLLSFRELPCVLSALEKLKQSPDLIVCDGQGIAHPRLCGIATHLGVLTDIPTIGCGKTRLTGTYTEPGTLRESRTPLLLKGNIIGSVVRTRNNCRPVFISVGHRISLDTACKWILQLAPRYRLPEVIRQAHTKAAQYAQLHVQ